MPKRLARRESPYGRLVFEREDLFELWLYGPGSGLKQALREIGLPLIKAGHPSGPWGEVCDRADDSSKPKFAMYRDSIVKAVRDAGLRPHRGVPARDFWPYATAHDCAFRLARVSNIAVTVPDNRWPSSNPKTYHFTVEHEVDLANPQAAVEDFQKRLREELKMLQGDPHFNEWRGRKKRTDFDRQAWCLFLRLNRRKTLPDIAKEIKKNGWPWTQVDEENGAGGTENLEGLPRSAPGNFDESFDRQIKKDIATLADRLGLMHSTRQDS